MRQSRRVLPKRRELSNPRGRPNQRDMSITDGKPRAAYFDPTSKRGVLRRSVGAERAPLRKMHPWRGSSTLIRRAVPRWRLSAALRDYPFAGERKRSGRSRPARMGATAAFHRLSLRRTGLWLCAAMARHTRPAGSLGVGKRLAGQLRGAGDKRQEPHDTGGSDSNERYAQRALPQQSS